MIMTERSEPLTAAALDPLSRGLRQAAVLIAVGLLVELLTLFWAHPTAFLTFAFVGGALMAAGVARYLFAILMAGGGSAAPDGTSTAGAGARGTGSERAAEGA